MAKTPKKAWMKQDNSKAGSKEMVSLPFLHNDEESVRLRAVISGKKEDAEQSAD